MCYLLEGQPLDAGRESFLLAQGSFRKCRSYGDVSSVSSDCEGDMPSDLTGLPAKRRAGSSENLLYLEALAAAAEASAAASPATVLKSPPSSRLRALEHPAYMASGSPSGSADGEMRVPDHPAQPAATRGPLAGVAVVPQLAVHPAHGPPEQLPNYAAVKQARIDIAGSSPPQAAPPPARPARLAPSPVRPRATWLPAAAGRADERPAPAAASAPTAFRVLELERRFTQASAVASAPAAPATADSPPAAVAQAPPEDEASDGASAAAAAAAARASPGLPPLPPAAAAARPCSLFTASSMQLVEPPSLIAHSPPSREASPSPPPSFASPFLALRSAASGGAGPADSSASSEDAAAAVPPQRLHHCASESVLNLATRASEPLALSLGAGSSGDNGVLCPLRMMSADSVALPGPSSRASMDPFVASSSHLNEGSAAEELFYRLNHARQTVDFVKRQAAVYAPLGRGELDVWEALGKLDTLREYETALLGDDDCDPSIGLVEHALQTAEACRLAFPNEEWLHLVGLIHNLGKLLAHADWGAEPQWAVCGETFPVGCRFHPSILHSQFFSANPDRRRRAYSTATGMYAPGCGLNSVLMSWSASEYLYMVLVKNRALLPPEALFVLRYHRAAVLLRPGAPYSELLSAFDRRCLPWVKRFNELARYTRRDLPGRLEGQELRSYYDGLIAKYLPGARLRW